MTGLRVLANLCSIVPGQVGGSEVYASRLLSAVASLGAAEGLGGGVEIASMAGTCSAHPELASLAWNEAPVRGGSRVLRVAAESTWLARLSAGFDLVHHFGGRLPARRSWPAVVTVHDIQPLDLPGNFSVAKRMYLGWAVPRSARAAAAVTVPSQWVADRMAERLSLPRDRFHVVPSTYAVGGAADGADTGAAAGAAGGAVDGVAAGSVGGACGGGDWPAERDWPTGGRPFLLYPAATYPHKNHDTLIAAHAAVWARHREPMLVLTGGRGRAHPAVARLVAASPGVVHLGWVDEHRLAGLLTSAVALVFPSRYEGFGLPVLEAMAAGTPVVAARAAALPEVLGDAGLLVEPDDLDGWIDALHEVSRGSAQVVAGVERGRARADRFSPERSARRLLYAWQRVAESQP